MSPWIERPLVLVVDDDPHLRDVLEMVLSFEGYRVESVCDGTSALERLRASPPPAVVLLDLIMPGLSGWDVLEGMARTASGAHPFVVVLSALAGSARRSLLLAGATAVLDKPIGLSDLLATVRQCTQSSCLEGD